LKSKKENTTNLKVSVVIPAYNEEDLLPFTLNSLKNQDFKDHVEIVVCDNNSTDKTSQIAKKFGAKVVFEKQKGTSYAYDTGMRAASGDLILVTNADTLLPSNWISQIVNAYKSNPDIVAVGTKVEFYNAPAWVNAMLKTLDLVNPVKAMWGVSMSCRRDAFYQVGGFQQGVNTNEDAIFTLKIKKYGRFKRLNNVVVQMDGRRFNNGFLNAIKAWTDGFGWNALSILINYSFKGSLEGKIKDFEDFRVKKD